MRFQQKFALITLIIGAVTAAPFFTGKLIVNITPSMPRGLWLLDDGEIKRGDAVQVPFSSFKFTDWVPEAYHKKSSWGKIPFLKRVAGLPGDKVEVLPEGFTLIQERSAGRNTFLFGKRKES